MKIGNFDTDEKVMIVAEIGNNHEGNFEVAKELVYKAKECEVDAVKFQTIRADSIVSRKDEKRFKQVKSFELSYEQFEKLSELAHSLKINFISTACNLECVKYLTKMVDAFKIASGDNNFYPLLETVAHTGKPLIISSGVSDLEQITKTVEFVNKKWCEKEISGQLAILHCVSSYPTPVEGVNLRSIQYLKDHLPGITIGYSDHMLGVDASIYSVMMGAKIIEKHYTLNKNYSEFRDHKLSADVDEMKELVKKVRLASLLLGKYEKKIMNCEKDMSVNVRRSIVSSKDLYKGQIIQKNDINWIRPAGGLPPGKEYLLIGKKLNQDVKSGEQLLEVYLDESNV